MQSETVRLAALYAHDVLDTAPDPVLDSVTAMAAEMFEVNSAAISLIDSERQWFKSRFGGLPSETPRSQAFCDHTIQLAAGETLMVEDALAHPLFRDNPLVTQRNGIRFYLGAPLVDPSGQALGALCVIDNKPRLDVTAKDRRRLGLLARLVVDKLELKRTLRMVDEGRRLLNLAESVAGVGHWSLRRDGRVFWSDEVYRIHGLSRDSFNPAYDSAIHLYHPEDRGKVSAAVEQAFATLTGFSFELRLVRADGSIRQVTSRAICELDEAGEAATLFGVFQDVTEQSQLVAAAKAAAHAKSDFLANMSHELRTPLNSIIGFTHVLMRDDKLDEAQRSKLKRIEEAGHGLLTIVNDVLDFSKIEEAGVELRAEPFSPTRLVETAAALVENQAVEKGLALEVDCPSRGLRVVGDPDRLRQVLMNLLTNALKFTQAGKVRLLLQARPRGAGSELAFRVCDTGIGMTAEQTANIFRRFAQADGSISRRFGGTGLGLAISKRLVEAMGGEIEVWSELGYGSTFEVRVTLPAAELEPEADLDGATGPAEAPTLSAVRVLAAEDVPVNQELLRLMLAPLGCQVTVVDDGGAAVEAIEREPFDLVLMDMQMPVMDGLEATRMIRRLGGAAARTPIVALTANVLPEQIERCRRAGMNDHVAKPFVTADLQAVVAKWASQAGAAPSAAPADANRVLDDLIAQIGPVPIHSLLNALDAQFAKALDARLEDGEEALARMAHGLRGAAATLGYVAPAKACEALETAHRDGEALDGRLAALQDACRDTRLAISARLAA